MIEVKLPPLDLRQLEYFVALAEQGSITSAAALLGLAQPTLSENISRLERRLEVQLLVRGPRGIQLTDAGAALADHARNIIRSAELAIDDIRHLGGQAQGLVSVCFTPSFGLLLSVPLAETIKTELPLVRLRIAEGMSGDILDRIAADRLDFGCVYEIPDSSLLSSRALLDEELFVATAPDNWPGAIRDGVAVSPISAQELERLPLVLPSPNQGSRNLFERSARAMGIQLNVWIEIDSLPQTVEVVSRASAYSITSQAAVIHQLLAGQLALVPIAGATMRRTAYLVRKRSRPITRASMAVEAAMVTIIRELVERYRLRATIPPEGG